jgi:hypothetical protein
MACLHYIGGNKTIAFRAPMGGQQHRAADAERIRPLRERRNPADPKLALVLLADELAPTTSATAASTASFGHPNGADALLDACLQKAIVSPAFPSVCPKPVLEDHCVCRNTPRKGVSLTVSLASAAQIAAQSGAHAWWPITVCAAENPCSRNKRLLLELPAPSSIMYECMRPEQSLGKSSSSA